MGATTSSGASGASAAQTSGWAVVEKTDRKLTVAGRESVGQQKFFVMEFDTEPRVDNVGCATEITGFNLMPCERNNMRLRGIYVIGHNSAGPLWETIISKLSPIPRTVEPPTIVFEDFSRLTGMDVRLLTLGALTCVNSASENFTIMMLVEEILGMDDSARAKIVADLTTLSGKTRLSLGTPYQLYSSVITFIGVTQIAVAADKPIPADIHISLA